MKLPGKLIVPVVAVAILGAIAYISYRRISLLKPGLEGPRIGEVLPDLPLEASSPDAAKPVFPQPETECLLIILRGYAGYVDQGCVDQVVSLARMTDSASRRRILLIYPGAHPGREFPRLTAKLAKAGVDHGLFNFALDQELYAVGALDAYGDPALPSAWHVAADGTIIARAYGTAADRSPLTPVIAGFLASPQAATAPTSADAWQQALADDHPAAAITAATSLVRTQAVPPPSDPERKFVTANHLPEQFLTAQFDQFDYQLWQHAHFFQNLARRIVAEAPQADPVAAIFTAVADRLAEVDPKAETPLWPTTIWQQKAGLCDRQAWVFAELAYQLGYHVRIVYLDAGDGNPSPHTICELRSPTGKVWTADPFSNRLLPDVSVAQLSKDPALAARTWPDRPDWQRALESCQTWIPAFPQDFAPRNQALHRALGDSQPTPRFGEPPFQRLAAFEALIPDNERIYQTKPWFYPFRVLREQLADAQ